MDDAPAPPPSEETVPLPTLAALFGAFFSVGAQSFGGGQATAALIRRTIVERHGWVGELEYARFTALCQIAPGMNLIALTALLGRRLGGAAGVAAALLGLLIPSVALTILLAALLKNVGRGPAVQAALQNGVVPATVGVGFYGAWRNSRALLGAARKEGGWAQTAFAVLLCAGSAAAALWAMGGRAPVFAIMGASGLASAAWGTARRRRRSAA
jgi:chromate transporter